jgi:hypothetical protein
VKRTDIKDGLRVIDTRHTPDVTYTWITGGRFIDGELISYVCDNCGYPDQFVLREDEEVHGLRGTFCIQCAGLEDLEPIVSIVK